MIGGNWRLRAACAALCFAPVHKGDEMASDLSMPVPNLARRFGGIARLYGEPAMAGFHAARVVVVGLGGVGSWAAEALARSAVGQIMLVDMDHIAESNVNRQIHAIGDTFGQSKVLAMAQRIGAINPACVVDSVDEFASGDNALRLVEGADVVIDCVDEVRAKVALIAAARTVGVSIVTCGAAGGRKEPSGIRCADLGLLTGDPLLAKVRHRLRRQHGFPLAGAAKPRFNVTGVYSDEPVQRPQGAGPGLACAGYGSSVAVTATMGFVAAAQALTKLAARTARGDSQRA
jgi:tRNA threonylcarbamoyladenosine dehydratase